MLVDARTVTLPVLVYNAIRSTITPDLAAVSVVYVVARGGRDLAARPPGRPRAVPQSPSRTDHARDQPVRARPALRRRSAPRCWCAPRPTCPRSSSPARRIVDAVPRRGRCRRGPARPRDRPASSSTRPACSPPRRSSPPPSAALEPEVKEAIRYAVDNIRRFHERAEARADVADGDPARRLRRRALDADPLGRLLRPARQGRLPVGDDDDHGPGRGRRRARDRRPHARRRPRAASTPPACSPPARPASAKVYRLGGAVAVAAAAFGTATVPKVAKIVGPGSPWVVAAKRLRRRPDRHRPAGRPQRGDRARRRHRQPRHRRPRPPDRGRARARQLGLPGHRQPRGRRAAPAPACPELIAQPRPAAPRLRRGGALRPARRHRARAVLGRGAALRQRLRARASRGPVRRAAAAPGRHPPCRRDPARPEHADHHRQFLPRPRLRPAHRRLGAHLVGAAASTTS